MLKKTLLIISLFSIIMLWGLDDLDKRKISSEYDKTFTAEKYQANYTELKLFEGYDFPLQSGAKFVHTLNNYFTAGQKKQSLLYYQNYVKSVEGHVLGGVEYYRNEDSDSYLLPYYGFEVKANYKNLYLAGKWWKGHTTQNNDYSQNNQLINSWTQADGDMIYIDKIQGEIKYESPNFGYVSLNRGKLDIGSNIGGSIILNSAKTNDYSYLNYHYNFGDFSVDFVHASLLADSINTPSDAPGTIAKEDAPDKYLALHRFGWRPSDKLFMFVGEEIFYGNRGVDYNYFLPVGFWRITEHNQADRDNVLIFGGIEYSVKDNLHLFTNVIFDELSKSKIFTSWWGNKYAIQTGLKQENLINSPLFTWKGIGAEFTAVRPWIYTHKYIYSKASNDNQPLGFADGANLLKYTVESEFSLLNERVDWIVNASYMRQGSEGNNFSMNYQDLIDDFDTARASWLDGSITDTYKLKQELDFKVLYSHRVKLSYEYVKVRDASAESELAISYQTRF